MRNVRETRCRARWNRFELKLPGRPAASLVLPLAVSWLMAGVALGASGLPEYQIQTWQAEQGLPQNTVTSLTQTQDGYLWMGTQNGLARFDGVHFQVFDEDNTPAIKSSRIVQIFESRNQALWVGTEKDGLVCFQGKEAISFKPPSRGTTLNFARALCDDGRGALWMVTCEWQLIRLAAGKFSVPSQNWQLAGATAKMVVEDRAGQIWVGTEKELAIAQGDGFGVVWSQASEPNFAVEYLSPSLAGGCWVAANGRLRRFDGGHWVADLGSYGWTNAPIYGMCEDRQGQLWVATLGGGLYRYAKDGAVLHITTRDGLPTDFVHCVMEDREGNIWAGTEGGGVCRLKAAIFHTIGVSQGLASDQVMSLSGSADGGLWIGHDGNGLDYLKDGRVRHFNVPQLGNGHVWSVIEDRLGTVWAGTWGGLFKSAGGEFTNCTDGSTIGWVVLALYEDTPGGIWLGQQAFGALTRVAGNDRELLRIPGADANIDIRAIAEDANGNLWFGSNGDGLYRRSGQNWLHLGKAEGLGSEAIWALYPDRDGSLWIGTCRGGLSRWSGNKLQTWTTKDGLPNNVICQILEDNHGNLWLGSYGGVFRVGKNELQHYAPGPNQAVRCVVLGREDGLPSLQCQGGFQPSGYKSKDGKLWFPTGKGLAMVDPEDLLPNLVPPPVVIEEMVVDGRTRLLNSGKEFETPAGVSPAKLIVPPGKHRLEFHYAALSFTAPAAVRFKYRLEGLEGNWQEAWAARSVSYPQVPPGDYKFHVIACNNDGIWNDSGASLAITVLPYYWESSWFLSSVALLVLGSVAGLARFIGWRKLQRRLERAEREGFIARERARIANDIHDDLGANLTEIYLLSELAQNTEAPAQEVQADLAKITTKARDLTRLLDGIVWAVDPQNDTLDNFVTYACNFAQDYLRLAKMACRLDLPDNLPHIMMPTDLRHNLFMVFKETLHNVVKHSGATEVRIQFIHRPPRLLLVIRDNGKGFSQPEVWDEPCPPANLAGDRDPNKSGLLNMRKRVAQLGGEFELCSRPQAGTEVKLTIQLPANGAVP